jgi:hypothetical protein
MPKLAGLCRSPPLANADRKPRIEAWSFVCAICLRTAARLVLPWPALHALVIAV